MKAEEVRDTSYYVSGVLTRHVERIESHIETLSKERKFLMDHEMWDARQENDYQSQVKALEWVIGNLKFSVDLWR